MGIPLAYRLNTVHTPARNFSNIDPSPLHAISQSGDNLNENTSNPSSPTASSSPSPENHFQSSNGRKDQDKDRQRATAKSPIYGHVQGVFRGANTSHRKRKYRQLFANPISHRYY